MTAYIIGWTTGLTVATIATALFNHRALAEWAREHYQEYRARKANHGRRAAQ